jgi:hypothetical protein
MKRKYLVAAALASVLAARDAHGDGGVIYHVKSPSTLETDKGNKLQLPPGYFLDEDTWQERDAEMHRLQELDVRLTAENKSLRESATGGHWKSMMAIGMLGVVVGISIMAVK